MRKRIAVCCTAALLSAVSIFNAGITFGSEMPASDEAAEESSLLDDMDLLGDVDLVSDEDLQEFTENVEIIKKVLLSDDFQHLLSFREVWECIDSGWTAAMVFTEEEPGLVGKILSVMGFSENQSKLLMKLVGLVRENGDDLQEFLNSEEGQVILQTLKNLVNDPRFEDIREELNKRVQLQLQEDEAEDVLDMAEAAAGAAEEPALSSVDEVEKVAESIADKAEEAVKEVTAT